MSEKALTWLSSSCVKFSQVEWLGASRGPLFHVDWLKGFDTLIDGSGTELVSVKKSIPILYCK